MCWKYSTRYACSWSVKQTKFSNSTLYAEIARLSYYFILMKQHAMAWYAAIHYHKSLSLGTWMLTVWSAFRGWLNNTPWLKVLESNKFMYHKYNHKWKECICVYLLKPHSTHRSLSSDTEASITAKNIINFKKKYKINQVHGTHLIGWHTILSVIFW